MINKAPLVYASIYVKGALLDPEQVSMYTCIMPTKVNKNGEFYLTSKGKKVVLKTSLWQLASDTKSDNILDHIDNLLSKFSNYGLSLRKIEFVEEAYLDAYISFAADDDGGIEDDFSLCLSANIMEKMVNLGLELKITVCVVPE